MPIRNRFHEMHDELTAFRQDLHAHPEILFDVERTAGKVAGALEAAGVDEVTTGVGRTGVVGVIRGRTNQSGRVIGLRADMDALPMTEATGLPHASSIEGAMHACGHDGHTTMLLGAARYLAETRNFDGTVVVIFQPAEEGGGGGREMCEDGLMARWQIDEVYGMHNWPGMPVGEFAIRTGPFFAAADQFQITCEGLGGHAAKPHECVDTTVMAAQMVLAFQTIASRNTDPLDHIVVSVTSFETDSKAHNIIPQVVTLRGTLRTFRADVRDTAIRRLREIATGIATTFGGKADLVFQPGYPVMANADQETGHARAAAEAVGGTCHLHPMIMGGEDFAFMLNERPGAYILIGNGDSSPVHHPLYDFDDAAIPVGSSYWVELVEQRLRVS